MRNMPRVKISLSLDPVLVRDVDSYLETHSGSDRSKVVDEALKLWSAAQQRAAMERQFEQGDDLAASEYEDWRHIRREATRRRVVRN